MNQRIKEIEENSRLLLRNYALYDNTPRNLIVCNTPMAARRISNRISRMLEKEGFAQPIAFNNLSTGLKSFVIIKMLIEKGLIKEKDVLVLDEPEIHLHPQWQIAYAELIVLLQKYFDLSIIVTTHSPYFLDAINLFSVKHGLDSRVNYYLSSMEDNSVKMTCVTGNVELIYQKMASPIQMLDSLRYELSNK